MDWQGHLAPTTDNFGLAGTSDMPYLYTVDPNHKAVEAPDGADEPEWPTCGKHYVQSKPGLLCYNGATFHPTRSSYPILGNRTIHRSTRHSSGTSTSAPRRDAIKRWTTRHA